MSASYNLYNIFSQREKILKANLFMFLHDIGKLQPGHQSKFIRGYKLPRMATKFSHYTHILDHPSLNPIVSWEVSLPEQTGVSLANIIKKHHGANEENDGLWVVLSQRIDRLDSKWDRDDIISEGVQPIREFISITSPFGWTSWAYRRVEDSSNLECKPKSLPWPLYYAGPTKFSEQKNDCLDRLFRCLMQIVQISNKYPYLKALRKPNRIALRLITTKACGDTRFSVNDITLWDHSVSTAILFKILASWSTLTNPDLKNNRQFPRSNDERFTRWFRLQLLPLRIDGLAYLAQSNNIPDLLARRKLLNQIYDTLQDILEWEFPLAGEVYRDENGPVFLTFLRDKNGQNPIPLSALQLPKDSNDRLVLSQAYAHSKSLEDYLHQATVVLSQGDLTLPPEIPLFTYTQKSTNAEGEKSLGDLLADEQKQGLWLQADVATIQDTWEDTQEEVCPVCGLRPLGFGAKDSNSRRKAISRKMCGVCLERRVGRAKTWAQGVHKSAQERFWNDHPETVWLDEVADANGRLALIVGYLPLEHWLDGTLVESLAMFKQKANQRGYGVIPDGKVDRQIVLPGNRKPILGPKPVSYSRIRRIWETTRRFWQDIAPTDAPPKELRDFCNNNGLNLEDLWEGRLSLEESVAGKTIGEKRSRLFLKAANADELAKHLGPFHAYEMEVQGRKVAVLWVPGNATNEQDRPLPYRGGFWVIENLAYLDQVFGRKFQKFLQRGREFPIYEPSEYGRPGLPKKTSLKIESVHIEHVHYYTPLIPILAEPRTFMALVPADKALKVVQAIKIKYEREMGKVRNRLPLHLGVVYADSHTPLRIILDAGRRMLSQKAVGDVSKWKVLANVVKQSGALPVEVPELSEETQQFNEWYAVKLEHKEAKRTLTWYVPAVMGDGQTEDHWYPYAFWQQNKDGNTDPGGATESRTRYYQAPNPFDPDDNNQRSGWLVHSGELKEGDTIYFAPATFDFQWLGSSADRFKIAYDKMGYRRGALSHRPYLLDELDTLQRLWDTLSNHLTSTQIHALVTLIETRRAEWLPKGKDKEARCVERLTKVDEAFRKFCRAALANAEWKTQPWNDGHKKRWLDEWADYAVRGWLTDVVELWMKIMKQKPAADTKGGNQ